MTLTDPLSSPIRDPLLDPFGTIVSGPTLLDSISGLNVEFELDATLEDSYGGSGKTWADVENSNDFYLGEDGAADDGDEPTFTGSAGDSGAYFAMDGGDWFALQASNPAIFRDLHKTTGGTSATFLIAFRTPASPGSDGLFSTSGANGTEGFTIRSDGIDFGLFHFDGSTNTNVKFGSLSGDTDYLVAVALDFTNGTYKQAVNAASFSSFAISPNATTGDATHNLHIASYGSQIVPLDNGHRVYGAYCINGIMTDAQLSESVAIIEARHNRTYVP